MNRDEKNKKMAVKKTLRIIERIIWRRETQMKFAAIFALRSKIVEAKSEAEKIQYKK